MGYVWLVCVCALHVCVEAHSPQLDKSDHDHLDHRHRHLVSDDNTAPGMTLTLSMCARCLVLLVFQRHHLFNLCARKHSIALPGVVS